MRKVKNIVFYHHKCAKESVIRGPAIAYQTYLKYKDSDLFRRIAKNTIKAWRKLSGPSKKAKYFHREVQEKVDEVLLSLSNPELIQCGKGCSACCHTQVSVTEDEAEHLARKIQMGQVKIDRTKLAMQSRYSEDYDKWMLVPYESRGCVFLDKNKNCSVYEDRPAVCRTNYALSDAYLCETKDGQTQPQRLLLTVDADLVVALVFELSVNKGSLPKLLHEALIKQVDLFR